MKKFLTKKRLLVGGGIVLLLIAAGAAGYIASLFMKAPTQDSASTTVSGLPKEIDDIQNLRATNTDEANKKIEEGLNNPNTSADTKYMLYMQKGHISRDAGDFKAALDSYTLASKAKETAEVFIVIGETNFALGDKSAARTAYEKAITLLDTKSPLYQSDKTDLEQRIEITNGKEPQ